MQIVQTKKGERQREKERKRERERERMRERRILSHFLAMTVMYHVRRVFFP